MKTKNVLYIATMLCIFASSSSGQIKSELAQSLSRQVLVNLSEQEVTITENGKVIFRSPCSSGRPTLPTPSNVTTVIGGKEKLRHSKQYNNSPMPWFVDTGLKDSNGASRGIGIHEGSLKGYPSTHRCIRLPEGNAKKFFDLVDFGTPLRITGNAWDYLKTKFEGFKLLEFDKEGNLLGFKRTPEGKVPKEFLEYIDAGGKIDICSLNEDGSIAVPPSTDKSTWWLMFEFMDHPKKQGFHAKNFEAQTGIPVSFNP